VGYLLSQSICLLNGKRRLLSCDGWRLLCHFRVECNECLPLLGNIVLVEDCINRAFMGARLAVDAVIGIDIQHLLTFVKAVAGADNNAISMLAAKAGSGHDKGHKYALQSK